ncbi:MAG: hypothetical protein GY937_28670 [bacterium]|nr:hypothetical protein [bacterium]
MNKVFRWIGIFVAGLVALVVLAAGGLYVLIEISRLPHDHRTVWIDGPGAARIRSHSWIEGGNWMDDPYDVHEYTLVERDGTETLIGEGPAPLDSKEARLYEYGEQATLVVRDIAYSPAPYGRWASFRAKDRGFIHRHYAPFTHHSIHPFGQTWRSTFTGLRCRIASVDLPLKRMVSACGSGLRSVNLVFSRRSPEDPWEVDAAATFAGSPPPERAPFPEAAHATLTAVRVVPPKDLRALPVENYRLDATMQEAGAEIAAEIDFEIRRDEPVEVTLETAAFRPSWSLQGGWVTDEGWPVLYWPGFQFRAQPWGDAFLVHNSFVTRDDATYLIYLELRPMESRAIDGS